jgi:hypothetical protein
MIFDSKPIPLASPNFRPAWKVPKFPEEFLVFSGIPKSNTSRYNMPMSLLVKDP